MKSFQSSFNCEKKKEKKKFEEKPIIYLWTCLTNIQKQLIISENGYIYISTPYCIQLLCNRVILYYQSCQSYSLSF